jgi:chemotaxis protein methyltransferase CheR
MVTFSYHNLAEDPYPSLETNTNAMDLVLCRNVLMYFSPDRAKTVVGHLYRSLIDGGWLIPSAVEGGPNLFAPFVFANFDGATLYRKIEAAIPRAPANPLTAPSAIMAPDSAAPVSAAPRQPPPISVVGGARALEPEPSAYQTALTLYGQGRYGEAVEMIAGYLTAQPDDNRAMLLLARTYANQGRLAEALQWCTKAIAGDRLAAGNHYLLAMIHQERGDLSEASTSLKRALFLEPQFVLAQFALANLARIQGKHRDSTKHYRNTLALLDGRDPDETLPESEGMTVGRLREIARHAKLSDVAE